MAALVLTTETVEIIDPWWRTTLDILIALGTLGAAIGAVWAAVSAGRIAKDDRRQADRRAEEDRAFHQAQASLSNRLQHLLELSAAFEAWQLAARTIQGDAATRPRLLALLLSSPVDLPTLRGHVHTATGVQTDSLDEAKLKTVRDQLHQAIVDTRLKLNRAPTMDAQPGGMLSGGTSGSEPATSGL